jgi:hypothetical protein
MRFLIGNKAYDGESALEVVDVLKKDLLGERSHRFSLRQFLLWSLLNLADHIPLRELDVSNGLSDEALARNYLSLRHEYKAGEIVDLRPER